MAKRIKLTKGKYAIVDDADFGWLSQFKWHYSKTGNRDTGYARAKIKIKGKIKLMYMHRLIMNANNNKQVDHKNRRKLDNRRNNLRFCSASENCRNKKSVGVSKYLGVYKKVCRKMNKMKEVVIYIYWVARIRINENCIFLGQFKKEKDAAIAYNKSALVHYGEFANLNKV